MAKKSHIILRKSCSSEGKLLSKTPPWNTATEQKETVKDYNYTRVRHFTIGKYWNAPLEELYKW